MGVVILNTACNFTQCMILHTVYTFTLNDNFELLGVTLRCFVARQLLSRIYALLSVKFPGLKMRLCKKDYKYQVWASAVSFIFTSTMELISSGVNVFSSLWCSTLSL